MEEVKYDYEMKLKEFMEWFVCEYSGRYLPSEILPCIHRLEGLSAAKDNGSEEGLYIKDALDKLRDFETLLKAIKEQSNWKYVG